MSEIWNMRIQNKHDTEAEWKKVDTFIPLDGEIIIYDVDEQHGCPRLKIGDGKTSVVELPVFLEKASPPEVTVQLSGDTGLDTEITFGIGNSKNKWDDYVYVTLTDGCMLKHVVQDWVGEKNFGHQQTINCEQLAKLLPGSYTIETEAITVSHRFASSDLTTSRLDFEIPMYLPTSTLNVGSNVILQKPTNTSLESSYMEWGGMVIWVAEPLTPGQLYGPEKKLTTFSLYRQNSSWVLQASADPNYTTAGGTYTTVSTFNFETNTWSKVSKDGYQIWPSTMPITDLSIASGPLVNYLLTGFWAEAPHEFEGEWELNDTLLFDDTLNEFFDSSSPAEFVFNANWGLGGITLTIKTDNTVILTTPSMTNRYENGKWELPNRRLMISKTDKLSLYMYKWINTNCKKVENLT